MLKKHHLQNNLDGKELYLNSRLLWQNKLHSNTTFCWYWVMQHHVIFGFRAVSFMVYYGITLNIGDLAGNFYFNFFVSGAVEIPAYVFTWLVLAKFGRRWPYVGSMGMAGVSLMCSQAVPHGKKAFPLLAGGTKFNFFPMMLVKMHPKRF